MDRSSLGGNRVGAACLCPPGGVFCQQCGLEQVTKAPLPRPYTAPHPSLSHLLSYWSIPPESFNVAAATHRSTHIVFTVSFVMRLIDTHTGRFVEFTDSSTAPIYAILSHTWAQDPHREQTYQDMVEIQEKFGLTSPLKHSAGEVPSNPSLGVAPPSPPHHSIWDEGSGLSEKVRKVCDIARRDGYRYIWVDSTCIDKTSSSELSEAINSMFKWYRDAQVCYTFLADVPSDDYAPKWHWHFQKSRWFERAWTLQELIAPRVVRFLSKDWKTLGTKDTLAVLIQRITHIDPAILTHERKLAEESVAERMRWASNRKATRVEDEAYSLLGIFGITMATLYGEGRRAFQRLQEEILQRIPDRSLFAWGECLAMPAGSFLTGVKFSELDAPFASSPQSFRSCLGPKVHCLSQEDFELLGLRPEEYTLTPHGIRAKLSIIPLKGSFVDSGSLCAESYSGRFVGMDVDSLYLIILGTQQGDDGHGRDVLVKLCFITGASSYIETLHVPDKGNVAWNSIDLPDRTFNGSVVFAIPLAHFLKAKGSQNAESKAVYLPYRELSTDDRRPPYEHPSQNSLDTAPTTISLSPSAKDILPPGYTISDLHPTEHSPEDSSFLTLHIPEKSFSIHIEYRHMRVRNPELVTFIEARIWTPSHWPGFDLLVDQRHGPDFSINTTLQGIPPYTSTIWQARYEKSQSPSRDVHVVSQWGDEVVLRLWLGFISPSHCHTHLEVIKTPSSGLPFDLSMGRQNLDRDVSYRCTDLKFTLLGSVTRALEARGYSVRVDRPLQNSSNCCSFSLVLSNVDSKFIISIQYFHELDTKPDSRYLLVVARVTLESQSSSVGSTGRMYRDGPYVERWANSKSFHDHSCWDWTLQGKEITLTASTGDLFTLHLGLALAWKSEYYLLVDIAGDRDAGSRDQIDNHHPSNVPSSKRVGSHDCIRLTLPGHIERALRMHGYKVHFERAFKDDLSPYYLQLFSADYIIAIEYSHHLSTDWYGEQELTFRASVTAESLERSQDKPIKSDMVEWPETRERRQEHQGWLWNLQEKYAILTLPTGTKITFRLGFYLVWLSEYCVTVEIAPAGDPIPPLDLLHRLA